MEHMCLFLPLQHHYTIARCFDCAGDINNDKEENMRRHQRLPWWPSLRDTRRGMINPDATPSGTSLPIFGHVCVCTTGKRLALVCVCGRGGKALEVCHLITSSSVNLANMFLAPTRIFRLFIYPDGADWRSVFSFAPFFLPYLISTVNRGDEGRHFLVRLNVHDGNRWQIVQARLNSRLLVLTTARNVILITYLFPYSVNNFLITLM